jgi:hypothetical protein
VATHPIGDQKELLILDEAKVILVVVTLESLVGLGRVAYAHEQQLQ